MRPIFCGNIEFDARQGDLERLFRKYGKVDRVDLKSGNLACYNYIFCMLNFYSCQDIANYIYLCYL
ncbi:putative RNA recognition motif domain, nucleotide-binding alpha-beta plait domain superfamily [Helianthus anomalus]